MGVHTHAQRLKYALWTFPRLAKCIQQHKEERWHFPGGPGVKNLPGNAGDMGSILSPGTKDPTYLWATEPMCYHH